LKKIDVKTFVITILSILVLILGYVAFKPKPAQYNDSILKYVLNRLKTANDSLIKEIARGDAEIIAYNSKIDSFQNLKPKIQTIYVTKYKEIDNANAGDIINEFSGVFSKIGIK